MLSAGTVQRRMAELPVAGLDRILGGRTPLILAPHPDDESLGCGGLIATSVAAGARPAVLVLTDGAASHPNSRAYPPARLRALRQAEARAAVGILGVSPERLLFLGLPDAAAPMDGAAFEAAVTRIAAAAADLGCDALLAPWRHDPHCDHLAAHLMAVEAARRAGHLHLSYPVWGWTLPPAHLVEGPMPDGWRLDIAVHLERKRSAIGAHRSQYADLITDDPTGFRLPADLLARFQLPFETFLTHS